jgi:hypothetical protein
MNNSMIVYGDIVEMKGTVDGRLTVGAFKGTGGTTGKITVVGSVQYQSRLDADQFVYSDDPDLFTNNGADVNIDFVENLRDQVYALDDILGIVSETDVIVAKKNLAGQDIAVGYSNPIYLDMIVMATGGGTTSTTDGSFYPEDMLNRPIGRAHRFGGVIQNRAGGWSLYSSGNHTAGLNGPSLWDFRATQPNGAPPYFPTTGIMDYTPNSWRESFIADADVTPWLPVAGYGS